MSEKLSKEKIDELIAKYERLSADPACPKGTTPLHFACDEAQPDVVGELLSRGADPDAANVHRFTPLHVVAKGWGSVPCAVFLLEAKADPNLKEGNAGMTPLHWAAAKAQIELVKLLLAHGADTTIRNDEGRTALEIVEINYAYSASDEKREAIRLLKEAETKASPRPASGTEKQPLKRPKGKKPLSKKKKVLLSVLAAFVLLVAGVFGLNLVYLSGKKSTVDEKAHTLKAIYLGKNEIHLLYQSVLFDADGKSVFTVNEEYGKGWLIRRWDVSTGRLLSSSSSIKDFLKEAGYAPGVRALPVSRSAVSPDLRTLAVGKEGNEEIVFHAAAEPNLRSDKGFILRYSNDGKYLAYGRAVFGKGKDKVVRIIDLAAGGAARTIYSSAHTVSALEFSPDGSLAALCTLDDPYIRVFDRAAGKLKSTLGNFLFRHTDSATAIAFRKDGKVLASGSSDNTVKFWDLGTGKQLATLGGHPSDVQGLAFSDDGEILAVLGGETLRLLKVPEAARK